MSDISAIIWKEWREVFGQRGFKGGGGIVVMLLVFGVFIPLQVGPTWVTSPVIGLAWAWVPLFLVMTIVSDAFAGERERHTLETLLATRLSDRGILLGKVAAAVGYSMGITVTSMVVGLVSLNLFRAKEGGIYYEGWVVGAMVGFGLLGTTFLATLGSVVSLRARTVRQAQQTLSALVIALAVLPVAGFRSLGAEQVAWLWARLPSPGVLGVVAACVLLILDAGLLAFAIGSFRRDSIIARGA